MFKKVLDKIKKMLPSFLDGLWILVKVILIIALIYLLLTQYSMSFLTGMRENSPFTVALGVFGYLIVFTGVIIIFSGTHSSRDIAELLSLKRKVNKMTTDLAEIKLQLIILNRNIEFTELNRKVDKIEDKLNELEEKFK